MVRDFSPQLDQKILVRFCKTASRCDFSVSPNFVHLVLLHLLILSPLAESYAFLDDATILSEPCKRKQVRRCFRSQLAKMVCGRDGPTNDLSNKHDQCTRRS